MCAYFSSKTTSELYSAFYDAQEDTSIGVVLLSAVLHQRWSLLFCSGGDQNAGHQGYVGSGQHRLNILEAQRLIRFIKGGNCCGSWFGP
jgi:naphthoate synthase